MWAKFIVKNPVQSDLEHLCLLLKSQNILTADYKTPEVTRMTHFMKGLNKAGKEELLKDFAHSKNLKWKCQY